MEEAFEKGIHKIGDKTDAVFSHIAGTDIRLTQMAKREFVAPVARTFEDLRCASYLILAKPLLLLTKPLYCC